MHYRFLIAALMLALCTSALAQAPATPAKAPAAQPAAKPDPAEVTAAIAKLTDVAKLRQLVAYYRQQGDTRMQIAALERLIQLRPHIGSYRLELAAVYAGQARKSHSYTQLVELQNSGYAYDLHDDARFAKVADTEVWEYLVKNFDANRQHFGNGTLAYTLPKADLLIESLAFDPVRKQLLVGSAREGTVYLVGKDSKLAPLVSADAKNGMWAVYDIAVDAKRNTLWVASTAVPHYLNYKPESDLGRAGIFKFELSSGKFLKSYLSPVTPGQPFFLSSITVGPDGAVFAADGVNNAIYQVRDDKFQRILHGPHLTSIRGLAVSPDSARLYFADHEMGILGIDLATGKPFDVAVPAKLALGGIESLLWYRDGLIAVQSTMNPARAMYLPLTTEGHAVAGVRPVEASNPEFRTLGLSTLGGDTLYIIANSQKTNYDRFGLLKKKELLEATRIVAADVAQVLKPSEADPINEMPVQVPLRRQ